MRKIANYKRNNNNKNKYKEKILKAKSITAPSNTNKKKIIYSIVVCQPSIHNTSTSNSSFYFSMNRDLDLKYFTSHERHIILVALISVTSL